MQSSNGTSATSRLPILVTAFVCALAGFGLGRWQGSMATAAVTEQLSSAQTDVKTGQKAIAAVEARSKRLEARLRINAALTLFKKGDVDTGMAQLMQADKALAHEQNETSKSVSQRLHALLQSGDVPSKTKELENIGASMDKDLMLSRASSG